MDLKGINKSEKEKYSLTSLICRIKQVELVEIENWTMIVKDCGKEKTGRCQLKGTNLQL